MCCTPLTMVSKRQHGFSNDFSRCHVLPFYHAFRFSLQFFTSSPLQSAWSFATSEAPSSWHRVHLHQDQKCNLNMPVHGAYATYAKEIKGKNPPGSVLKRFVIWIACKSSLPRANYNSFSLEESLFWSSIWMLTFWAMSEPSTCKWCQMSKKCPNQRQLKKVSLEGVIHYQVASNDPRENGKVWRKKSEKVVLKLCTLAALRGDAKT